MAQVQYKTLLDAFSGLANAAIRDGNETALMCLGMASSLTEAINGKHQRDGAGIDFMAEGKNFLKKFSKENDDVPTKGYAKSTNRHRHSTKRMKPTVEQNVQSHQPNDRTCSFCGDSSHRQSNCPVKSSLGHEMDKTLSLDQLKRDLEDAFDKTTRVDEAKVPCLSVIPKDILHIVLKGRVKDKKKVWAALFKRKGVLDSEVILTIDCVNFWARSNATNKYKHLLIAKLS